MKNFITCAKNAANTPAESASYPVFKILVVIKILLSFYVYVFSITQGNKKRNSKRPFDVMGEHGHVRVLGTQFMVDERMDAPEVMVTGGKVLFTARNSEEGVFLTKGKRARLLKGAAQPELLADYDINDVAWATHRLHFNNTPLSEVLEKLTELSGVRYTASDESKRLTGDFETDSIPQVIQVIEETLGVQIRLAYIGKQPK